MQTLYMREQLKSEPQVYDEDRGTWHPAKPENVKPGHPGWLRWRIKAAWHVLRGRAVPVFWM
jgi:hypothetical protein